MVRYFHLPSNEVKNARSIYEEAERREEECKSFKEKNQALKEEKSLRNLLTAITATFLFGFVPALVEFLSPESRDLSLFVRDIQCAIWIAYSFHAIQKNHFRERTLIMVFFIYVAVEAQQYFFLDFQGWNGYLISYSIFSILCLFFYLYSRFKQFQFKSDKINPENITLCFWKPKNGITLTASLIGLPFGGLCIYADGHLYGYRWGKDTYQKEKRDPKSISRCFTVIDTGFKAHSVLWHLDHLVGVPAGRPRIRCISTIKPILNLIGGKFATRSVFDLIPSHYAHGILGNGTRHSHS